MSGVVIDQARIDAPDFPRSQEWWQAFVPSTWVTAAVRDDGTVALDVSGEAHPSQGPRPAAAVRRNQERALRRWITNLPRLAVAVVEPQ